MGMQLRSGKVLDPVVATTPILQYQIRVFKDQRSAIRGGEPKLMTELFIPAHKIIVSSLGVIFKAEGPRNLQQTRNFGKPIEMPITPILMPTEQANAIAEFANSKLQDPSKKEKIMAAVSHLLV